MIRRKRAQRKEIEEAPTFTPCPEDMRASKSGRLAIACPLWNQCASSIASCGVVLVTLPVAFEVQASHCDRNSASSSKPYGV